MTIPLTPTDTLNANESAPDPTLLAALDIGSNSVRMSLVRLDIATGACLFDTTPVYRVYNNRPDANHRYTTSLATRDSMVVAGWIAEGYGPDAVAFCGPR